MPGAKSSSDLPGTVTQAVFTECLNWRWLPRVATSTHPSSLSIRSISLTFINPAYQAGGIDADRKTRGPCLLPVKRHGIWPLVLCAAQFISPTNRAVERIRPRFSHNKIESDPIFYRPHFLPHFFGILDGIPIRFAECFQVGINILQEIVAHRLHSILTESAAGSN